ncbi:M13-type metalloendopeptidase [Streptomyces chromofuscus]|uniref:M13 family metallopeptidase n=1 Tax=Streptomyces chromofuscus TaxID=42881 RepID=A0A7M2T742_STRCW|nr:M13 family metallopeptidase [Streptomyces chromofuscus]QOV44527.1 M13 family metallopeptidase [Streptomyces chromofuscus]GGT42688.1 peptidase M13 [Streptomyces chromofuscus]
MTTSAVHTAIDAGLDTELDQSVRPQDDFYRYTAGRWTDGFVLPGHRAEATMLSLLAEQVQDEVAAMISSPGQDADGCRIADLYTSFMDERRIEELGASALTGDLEQIRRAPDRQALARVLGRLQAQGITGAVDLRVAADTRGYLLELSPSGLGLPSALLYREARSERLRERYFVHVATMLSLAGLPDAETAASRVLRAETALSGGHAPPDSTSRAAARTCPATAAELAGRNHGFAWSAWLEELGQVPGAARVRLRPNGFLPALEHWWATTSLDSLRLWLAWRYVHEMAPFGSRRVFTEHFNFYWRDLTGARWPWPRRLRATAFVQTAAGDLVGERYLRAHLDPHTRARAADLVTRMAGTYRDSLKQAGWMRPDTRRAAVALLDSMRFEIGGPSGATDPVPLVTDPGDLIGNVKRGRARQLARQLSRLVGPLDHSEWRVLPQAVTAYYRHGLNQVVVPAGLLRPPVFTAGGDPARDHAVLGSIVCHEMSHALVRAWRTGADHAEFDRRTAPLVVQYDRYAPEGSHGRRVSGARTLDENIADITGLAVAQAAFADHLTACGTTGAERQHQMRRFFLLWATMWRGKRTPERTRERLENDPHAPPQFRCNGVLGHIPAFYEAFGVREGDGMHIRQADRFSLIAVEGN